MNISLRKAAALQNRIQETLRTIELKSQINVDEFQNLAAVTAAANAEFIANDKRRTDLILALYNIRSLVGLANASSGISKDLATAAFVDKRIAQLSEVVGCEAQEDLAIIQGRLDKIKSQEALTQRSRLYGDIDTVRVGVLTREQLAVFKQEVLDLKKEKQKINDRVLELNVSTQITLGDQTAKTLTDENLI